MNKQPFLVLLVVTAFFSIWLSSCRVEDDPEWDTELLIPLVNSHLDLKNMAGDSLIIRNSDSSLSLVYNFPFQQIKFDELLQIPDTTIEISVTLKTIKIGTRKVEQQVTLGQIARQNGSMGQIILNAHGSYLPIPPIPDSYGGESKIDATNYFETVEVKTGSLTAHIHNGLPIELQNVIVSLKNEKSGTQLLIDTIQSLKSKADYDRKYSLNGKTFEGTLVAEIINISSPGTGILPVKIDTNAAIVFGITIQVDEVQSATAIFPAQNLVDQQEDVEYNLRGPELKFMRIKSGKFKIIVASTLQDTTYIHYEIPGAKYMGIDPLVYDAILPPARPGDTVYIERTWDVNDYWYDLTGLNGDKVNSFFNSLVMRIDSTGRMVRLSLNDSVYIFYTLYDVIPDYVTGYLGQDTFTAKDENSPIDIFNNITSGSFDLSAIDLGFYVENGVGADGEISLGNIRALNTKTNKEVLFSSPVLNNVITIDRASDNPFKTFYKSFKMDETNSNAIDLIELMPDKLSYDVDVHLNPNGNALNYGDFIYSKSNIEAGLEFELPLVLSANRLNLVDTTEFDMSVLGDPEKVNSAEIRIMAENDYPFKTELQIVLLDDQYNILDSLFETDVIIEAGIAGAKGKVLLPTSTNRTLILDKQRINRISGAKYALIRVRLTTLPPAAHVKIYSSYGIKLRISGLIDYKTSL